jgi:hypothetical protein
MEAIGQGGAGERSVGGGSPWMEREENSSTMACRDAGRPCREWWAVFGTVAEVFEGLTSWVLGALGGNEDAGKCLFL